ncbi:MAG TPA: peptidylprolyl isomerase [Hyphomonadaceae bacterium]|nr:peptidylprolyl isomerase [Hyphomonadaceae bacterium]HPI49023.1 peptidylprolyl isomerase [Hyphomonadaceae bacterium]
MIGGIRKFAKSKWALVLLFIPLIISFGIFGFQDPFSGITGGGLSRVGDREIHARDLNEELSAEIDAIREQDGRVLTQADAIRQGIAQQVLQRLEYRNMILAYAEKTGIQASKQAVADLLINRAGAFKDALGRFNLDAVRARANDQKMSLKDFEDAVRDDLTAGYVTSAAFNAIKVPDILSLPVINYIGETRTLTAARLTDAAIAKPAEPTDAQLETWYNAHKEQFAQPERRRISVLSYSPDDFLDRVELTDEQVKAEYEKRIRDYSTPETREVVEYTSNDRNTVQAFIDLTQQGLATEEALKRSPGIVQKDLKVKPEEVSDERYRDLLFSLPAGKVHTLPLRLSETTPWFAVAIKSVTPGIPQPFETVAERARRDMALSDATRLYEDESEKFRDAAGGQPLEEIGKQFGFPVIQLMPVDQNARTVRGDQTQLLANNPALAEIFTLQAGQMTNLFEGDSVRAMYRLDEIVPPYTQPFADVKARVRDMYLMEQVKNAATKAATDMVAAVNAGKTFEQAAAASKMTVLPVVTATRQGTPAIDPAALQAAFELKAGETGVVPGQQGEPWVVRVDKIEPVTTATAAALRAQVAPQVAESLQNDLREVFIRGLQKEVEVKRDEVAIKRYFDSYLTPEGS